LLAKEGYFGFLIAVDEQTSCISTSKKCGRADFGIPLLALFLFLWKSHFLIIFEPGQLLKTGVFNEVGETFTSTNALLEDELS
jgi:hypothetical protein